MKNLSIALFAVAVLLLVAVPAVASGTDNRCSPAGTWWGANDSDQEYLFTFVALGGGHFSAVSDGAANYNDLLSDTWENVASWRGSLVKIDSKTYELTQVTFVSPSILADPALGYPDILGAHGILTLTDCDHFEVQYDTIPIWAWGQIPWVDAPIDDFGAATSAYTRMARP